MAEQTISSAVLDLNRRTTWNLESSTAIDIDIGHPQGLTRFRDGWLVTTVHPASAHGFVVILDRNGTAVHRFDVTDGTRFHPGGVHLSISNASVWIPVAEYRPESSTTVIMIDDELDIHRRFEFDDHLGAISDLGDDTLVAVSWGSRTLYRLSHDGDVLDRRLNPSHFIDYQDLVVDSPGSIIASGVSEFAVDGKHRQLGGLAVLDVDDLHIVHETPVSATMPSGRSITYNGFHVDVEDSRLAFHCLVDDGQAAIGHWTTT